METQQEYELRERVTALIALEIEARVAQAEIERAAQEVK